MSLKRCTSFIEEKVRHFKLQNAYSFNTSAGTSCDEGRSNRSYFQQDTDFTSGTHLHGPSAQISQSSSFKLICQTSRALSVFSYVHQICKSWTSYPAVRPLAIFARGSTIGSPSLRRSTSIPTSVNVPYL